MEFSNTQLHFRTSIESSKNKNNSIPLGLIALEFAKFNKNPFNMAAKDEFEEGQQDVIDASISQDDDLSYATETSQKKAEYYREKSENDLSTASTIEEDTSFSIKEKFRNGLERFLAHWRILLLGQFLSILLACSSSLSATMHFECNVSSPTFQTVLVFMLMSLHSIAIIRQKYNNDYTVEEKRGFSHDEDDIHDLGNEEQTGMELGASISIDERNAVNTAQDPRVDSMTPSVYENGFDNDVSNPTKKSHSMCFGLLPLSVPWWAYTAFAFTLVEASYLTFLAYRYTTLPSASLLDNVNILAAMVGSIFILRRRYNVSHVLGAFICVIGVFLNIYSDLEKSSENIENIDDVSEETQVAEYPKRILGDILAICGGLMVGFSDVLIEMFVKDFVSVHEYIGCVGIFGTVIAAAQAIILERKQIIKIFAPNSEEGNLTTLEVYELYADDPFNGPRTCSKGLAMTLIFSYAVCTYLFNFCMTRFLSVSESALLTLSLLTADLYSVIVAWLVESIPPTKLFYAAFVLVVIGVIVYEMAPSPLGHAEDLEMERGIEMEKQRGSPISLSWRVPKYGEVNDRTDDIDRHEIL